MPSSEFVTWSLIFGGTTVFSVLLFALYRVQLDLKASRHELLRKEAELSFALQVQKALLPRRLVARSGLEFAAVCIPARGISGDYYDVLEPSSGRLVFALADVSGKGVSAAMLMANVQAGLRMTVEVSSSLLDVVSRLNTHLYQATEGPLFVTLFLGEWRYPEYRLFYVNAGHHIPILLGSDRGRRLDKGGFPLGLFSDTEYEMGDIHFRPRDLLGLYSDGVTEAESPAGEPFGEERLAEVMEAHQGDSLEAMKTQVLKEVRSWSSSSQAPADDMTLMIVRATEGVK